MYQSDTDSGDQMQFQTHIHKLVERIARAPYAVAPERRDELRKILTDHSVQITVKDDQSVGFNCETVFGHIFTSIRSLQHFWVAACYFSCLYLERLKASQRGETNIPIAYNADIETVAAFYEMSCKAFKSRTPLHWPPDVKSLTPNEQYLELADEIFLLMCSFAFLHEVGHTKRMHNKVVNSTGNPETQQSSHVIELEADKWAYDWILSRWKEFGSNPKIFIKRTLGIIFTLAMADEFRFLPAENLLSPHPPAVDRLIQFYQDYKEEIETNEYSQTCFSAVTLSLQTVAMNNGQSLPQGPYHGVSDFLAKVKEMQY